MIAGLIVVRSITQALDLIGMFTFVAPVLFAAVVIYAAPSDRRFLWAALALAAPPTVSLITTWLPDAWLSLAPGDWQNATPLLQDIGSGAREIAGLAAPVGLALLGLALGGVRTFMSAVILALGALIAVANVIWFSAQPLAGFPVLELARSVALSVLQVLGWAFVFAAALESLLSLALVGSGLVFANVVISAALLWWQPGSAGTDVVAVVSSLPAAIGWGLLIAAVLRGEVDAVPARSRADRGSAVRRRAG